MDSTVDRVLVALNAHDLDAFVGCYDAHATIEDGNDLVLARGHNEIGVRYGTMFETFPMLHVESVDRWEVGPYVLQKEVVTGRIAGSEHHIAIYQLKNGRIVRERLLR